MFCSDATVDSHARSSWCTGDKTHPNPTSYGRVLRGVYQAVSVYYSMNTALSVLQTSAVMTTESARESC